MPQIIKLKRSATPGQVPTTAQLDLGEIAINTNDGKIFFKKDDGAPVILEVGGSVAGAASKVGASATAPTDPAPADGDLWFDTANDKLMYYDGTSWKEVGNTLSSSSITGNTTLGDAAGDTLTVNATSTYNAPVDMNSNLNVDGAFSTTGNSTIGNAAGDTLTVNATSTYNAPVDMNSSLNVDGAATFKGGVTIEAGDNLTFDGMAFNNAHKLTISNVSGTVVFGGWVLDTDTNTAN